MAPAPASVPGQELFCKDHSDQAAGRTGAGCGRAFV